MKNINDNNEINYQEIVTQLIKNIQTEYEKIDLDKIKDKKRLVLLCMLWGTYLGIIGSLPEKKITDEDIKSLKSIINPSDNKNINEINDFQSIIKTLSEFYSSLQKNQNEQINQLNNDLNLANLKDSGDLNFNLFAFKSGSLENLGNIKCEICEEEFNPGEIVNPKLECLKYIHGSCFIDYIEEELNNNRFPIKCPFCQNEKSHEINYKLVHDNLIINDKDKLAKKLDNISLNFLSENNPDEVSFCPTPGCSYMCFFDKNEFHLNCPLCKKSYCLQCKAEWHTDLTCQEYQFNKKHEENMSEEEKLNEKKFKEYIKGNRCKQCPKCKRWVEKNKGCDHITCPCGTHFCYKCGELRDPKDPYAHQCKMSNEPSIFVNNNNLFSNNLFEAPQFHNNNLFVNRSLFNPQNIINDNQNTNAFNLFNNNINNNPFINNNNQTRFNPAINNFNLFNNNQFNNNNKNNLANLFNNINNTNNTNIFFNNDNNNKTNIFKNTIQLFAQNNNNNKNLFENVSNASTNNNNIFNNNNNNAFNNINRTSLFNNTNPFNNGIQNGSLFNFFNNNNNNNNTNFFNNNNNGNNNDNNNINSGSNFNNNKGLFG